MQAIVLKIGEIDFNNLNSEQDYRVQGAYGQSKLPNLLFTYELQKRFETDTIAAAAHPGRTVTNLQAHTLRVFFTVEENVLLDPIQINPFSIIGIPFQAQGIAGSIEEVFWVLFY